MTQSCPRWAEWTHDRTGQTLVVFAGSDRGGERAAAMYTIIVTAKLNDIDPQA